MKKNLHERIVDMIAENKDIRDAVHIYNRNNLEVQKKAIKSYETIISYILRELDEE